MGSYLGGCFFRSRNISIVFEAPIICTSQKVTPAWLKNIAWQKSDPISDYLIFDPYP